MPRPTDAPLPDEFFSGGSNLTEKSAGLQKFLSEVEGRVNDIATGSEPVRTVLEVFTNGTRPDAGTVAAGTMIFNSDDNAPNVSDGASWRDMAGVLT